MRTEPARGNSTWRLRAERISISYSGLEIVGERSIEFRSQGAMAIVGPSGSGKTSLLSALGGLQKPATGTVTVLDLDGGERPVATAVAWIVQSNGLLRHRTALENVRLGRLTSMSKLIGDPELAQNCLERVGLAHRASAAVKWLSGGELRRLAVARSLMMERPFLFADEPTSGLDNASTQTVLDILFGHPDRGLVVATHDPAMLERCDFAIRLGASIHGVGE